MMGRLKGDQSQLFYEFDLDDVVPPDHLVRQIDAVLDLSGGTTDVAAGHPPCVLFTPSSRCECPFKCSERGLHARRPLARFGVAIGSVDRVIGNTARTCSAHIWQKAVA